MVFRERYISKIRGFYDSDLVKTITGVRRCGKSIVLKEIQSEISKSSDNIISLDFDNRAETSFIQSWQDVVQYVKDNRKSSLCYVFLDEIQEIDDWQKAVRSLRLENCSVFITGSNSKLLSSEFTKELSGRFVSFRIRPFVYKELVEYAKELDRAIDVQNYLVWGGFPKRLEFNSQEDLQQYISDLDLTIVSNDIINRFGIRKVSEFKKFANFILTSNARVYSAKSISDYMKSNGVNCSSNTIQKWIEYLKASYIIDEIPRYSLKAKKHLENGLKIYNCDVSLNSLRCKDNRFDLTQNLENVVYNELLYRDYTLSVYKDSSGREIDFIAEKAGKRYFIQVSYSVVDEKAYKREFAPFSALNNEHQKILITTDTIDYSTSTVRHININDFLINQDIL